MAWMIPIIANRRNRMAHHKIGGLISFLFIFLGLGFFFFLRFDGSDGFAFPSILIIGGIFFLISVFVIVGIIAAVASANSEKEKVKSSVQNQYKPENLIQKSNPYIIKKSAQINQEKPATNKPEKSYPPYQEIQFCRYCGEKLEKGAKFCHQCGIKI